MSVSATTVHDSTIIVRQLMNFARLRRYVHDDKTSGVRIRRPQRRPQPVWSALEVAAIIEIAKPPYRDLYVFLSETGCRIGEAIWLNWNDVDSKLQSIKIRAKEGWAPKTGNQRSIPLSSEARDILKSLRRSRGRKPTGWVFCKGTGEEQLVDRRALAYLKVRLNRLGLKGHLHTFRHFFISQAANHGVPERILRAWVGHVDSTTLSWYYHLGDDTSRKAMEDFSAAKSKGARSRKT